MTESEEPNAQEKTRSPDADPGEEPLPAEQTRIVIRPGGEVVIENLSEEMLELALQLGADPESLVCRLDPTDSATDEESEETKPQTPTDGDDVA